MGTPISWQKLPINERDQSDTIGVLLLDRPESANAFSGEILEAITTTLADAARDQTLRCLIISGRGKHFSAGADLSWMQASVLLSHDENLGDAAKLTDMFESLANFPRPTIAVVRGAAYGGAVGLAACCDIVLASSNARFCLSEARLGLLPAVIMPYLARRMMPGFLRQAALTSRVIKATDAQTSGLVDVVVEHVDLDEAVRNQLAMLLQTGPKAQTAIKSLLAEVRRQSCAQGDYTAEAIAAARTSSEGQAGLKAFFAKTTSPWHVDLPENFNLTPILEQSTP